MTGERLAALPLAKIAALPDGLIYQLAYLPRTDLPPLRTLTIRSGRFNETADVTPPQLAASVRVPCPAVGLEGVMGSTTTLEELATAKEREAKDIDATIAEREREFEDEIAEPRAGQIRARLEAKELRKAADRIAARIDKAAGKTPRARPVVAAGAGATIGERIVDFLSRNAEETFDRAAIGEAVGTSPNSVGMVMVKLLNAKLVKRLGHNQYQVAAGRKSKAA